MTRNMIFASGVAAIAGLIVLSSLMTDDDAYHRNDRGARVHIDIEVEDDEIVITSEGGRTVVHTKDGRQTCQDGDDALTITREDGSQTRIEC